MTDNLIFPAGADTFADRHASDPPRRAEDVNVMTGQIVKIEQYALGLGGAWSAWFNFTPKAAAVDFTTKVMHEAVYDDDPADGGYRRGRYRRNGPEVIYEWMIQPGTSASGPLPFGPDPVWDLEITGSPTGGWFNLSLIGSPGVTGQILWNAVAADVQFALNNVEGGTHFIVTGTNPHFSVTWTPRAPLGSFGDHPTLRANANAFTGGVAPGVTVTGTTVEDETDDVVYIGLPLPLDGASPLTVAESRGGGLLFPARLGFVTTTYDGADSTSDLAYPASFPLSTSDPTWIAEYANWMMLLSGTRNGRVVLNGGGGWGALAWDDFDTFGAGENVLMGIFHYFTTA